MAKQGYIKLYRQIQDSWIWRDHEYAFAWIDLLLLAEHTEHKRIYKGELKTYPKGTVNLSISALASRWGWTWKKTRAFLRALEKDDMVVTNVTRSDTTLSLVNYGFFQDVGERKGEQKTERGTNEGQNEGRTSVIYPINDKNVKEGKEASSRRASKKSYLERKADRDRAFEEAMKEIAEMRKNAEEKEENYGEE